MTEATKTDLKFALSARSGRTTEQPISYLMSKALANPNLISLAAGFVDNVSLPGPDLAKLWHDVLRDPSRAQSALQYGTTKGYKPLRVELYEHLARLDNTKSPDYPGTPEDLVVSTGSQQLLHLITDVLVDSGPTPDIVLTAWPSYFVYATMLKSAGATVRSVDLDDQGIVPDSLEAILTSLESTGDLSRVKILYLCSYHQNPTGLTLSSQRRPKVLNIIRKFSQRCGHRILIIEDAAYRELNFSDNTPPSIKKFDVGNEFVALLQTFSKPFAPGLKTGYGLLPRGLVEPVTLEKGGRDFGSANLCQHLMFEAMRRGTFREHKHRLRDVYASKCQVMLESIDDHLGDFQTVRMHWTRPTGGLYVWLTLPESIDTGRDGLLFAASLERGVLYVPGDYCYPPDPVRKPPRHMIRLSFGVPTVEQIRTGVQRLAQAIHDVAKS